MRAFVFALALAAIACSPPAGETSGDPSASPSAAAADGERFYGQERFSIVMSHTGRQTGTTTTHVREWGRRRAEINDTSISVAGFTQQTRNRVIYEGPRVTTVDTATGAASAITNPLYDQVVAAMRGSDGVEFGQAIMTQMGARATGENGVFAGHECAYWEIPGLGTRTCVTPWGATLHLVTGMGGITIEQTATEVRIGDGGPDEAFAYDAASVTEGPDLGQLMDKMKGN